MSDHHIPSEAHDEVEYKVESKIEVEKAHVSENLVKEENDKAYPPLRVVLPAVAALYLAVFLVALVRQT